MMHMGHDDHVGDTTTNTDAMHHHNNNNHHQPDHSNETDDGEVVPPPTDDAAAAAAAEDASDPRHHHDSSNNDNSMALRPLFFGNLLPNYSTEQITNLFEHPERFMDSLPPPPVAMTQSSSNTTTDETTTTTTTTTTHSPIPVDRIDMKRGYCFVFLKDATDLAEKLRIEAFCQAINGM